MPGAMEAKDITCGLPAIAPAKPIYLVFTEDRVHLGCGRAAPTLGRGQNRVHKMEDLFLLEHSVFGVLEYQESRNLEERYHLLFLEAL
jgi:hypothetical protein